MDAEDIPIYAALALVVIFVPALFYLDYRDKNSAEYRHLQECNSCYHLIDTVIEESRTGFTSSGSIVYYDVPVAQTVKSPGPNFDTAKCEIYQRLRKESEQ